MSRYFKEKEDFLTDLKAILDREYHENEMMISTVLNKKEEQWKNYLSKIIVLSKSDHSKARDDLRYNQIALLEQKVSVTELLKIFENIDKGFSIKNFRTTFDKPNFQFFGDLPSDNEYGEWPGKLYIIGRERPTPITDETVEYKKPCFRDSFEATQYWLNLDNFDSGHDGWCGSILIFLPNFSAKINNINYIKDKIIVELAGDPKKIKSLECQAVFKIGNETVRMSSFFNSSLRTEFEVKSQPLETYIQIVSPESERIDYYEETPFRHSGKIRLIKKETYKEIMTKIRNGENEGVEFKPFIRKGDKKEKEIIETVIAFANTKGGCILFGVNDHCEPIGIEARVLKGASTKPKTVKVFLEEIKKYLRKFVSDSLNKGVGLDFKEYVVSDKVILEMSIKEGESKPYASIRGNDIYIRKGSNNVRPDPSSELPDIISKRFSTYG